MAHYSNFGMEVRFVENPLIYKKLLLLFSQSVS